MSVIGFDIGNVNCVIAAAKRGGIDVLLNDEAKRESPAVVSFGEKQRFLGSTGAAFATANAKSTISQIKRLIGRQYQEPSVQEELKLLPFATSEGPRGGILIELEYLKIEWKLTPVEILGMLFTHLKQIAEKNLESTVVDCVIGIPSYFTDLQRREYLDAATIAGLRPLRLMHDGTAIALGYGMYKTDLLDSGPTNVIFVDIGHCDTQVTVAAFEQGKMDILSHSFDQNLGGRDFDEVLFKHFAAQFLEQYKIDVYSNARASIRLRASCEKLKKVLSANTEAPLSIECLIEDTDVRGIITRDEFEKLSSELLERVTAPCRKALKDSGLCVDEIYTIELVGSGSRIPAITKMLTSLFQKEPTRTLNASECVARGCALRCAMLSPTLQVRDYEVKDLFPYSLALPLDELKGRGHQELMLFPKGSLFPNTKLITHTGRTSFYFQVLYTNMKDLPAGVSPLVGHFKIGQNETSASEKAKVEFVVMLNDHGIFEIKSASVSIDERPSHMNALLNTLKMVTNSRSILNIAFSENLDVATTKDELLEARGREQMFAEQDKKVEQTKDQRNTLESFVYDTRSKLKSAYKRFVTDVENEGITKRLQETEEWLYEDSDDESDEQDYAGKLDGLKKLLEPIENRYKEEKKEQAKKPLIAMIEDYQSVADSLPPRKKKELLKACKEVEQYLEAHPSKDFDQIGWSNFIKKTMDTFKRICEEAIRPKLSIPKHVEPVDNKIKDENKVEAAKPLLSMIEEYRSVAESLPDENKMELINACTDVEQYLSGHSPENYDPIGWSNFIKKTMGTFKRICEEAIRPKLSIPKHVEPVDNKIKDENKVQAAKPLLSMIEEYRSVAESLPDENKMKLINACTDVEQYLSGHSPENYDPISWSNFIKKTMGTFKRMCEEAIQYKLSIPKHVPVDNKIKDENKVQATKPLLSMIEEYRLVADSLPVENKMKLINACKEVEQYLSGNSPENYDPIGWSNFIKEAMGIFKRHCEKAMQYKPSSPEHPEPVESDQSCNHVDSQTGNQVDVKQTGKSMDGNRTGNSMDGNRTGKPLERNQTGKPVERNQTGKPVERNQTSKLVDGNQTGKLVDGNQTGKPVKQDQTSKPVKPDQTCKPVDGNQTCKPVKPDQASKSVKPDQASKSMKPDQTSKSVKPDQASKPVKTDQTSKPVNIGQTDKPFASEQMDIP